MVLDSFSVQRLKQVHPELVKVLEEAIKYTGFRITYGFRPENEQNDMYARNLSDKRWPNSAHNYQELENGILVPRSRAIDFAPWFVNPPHIRWKDTEGFIYCAGIITGVAHMMNVQLVWGGDWNGNRDVHDQNLMDWGHLELKNSIFTGAKIS